MISRRHFIKATGLVGASSLAKLVSLMDHDHCKLMPDFGKMKGTDIYKGTSDMMPHTVVVSAKTHEINSDGSAD